MAKVVVESELCMKEMGRYGSREQQVLQEVVGDVETKSNSVAGVEKKTQDVQKTERMNVNKKRCNRCGSSFHNSEFKGCFAVGKECRKCGSKGHYAWMCAEWSNLKGVAVCEDTGEMVDRILSLGEDDKVYRGKRESTPKAWFTVEKVSVELMVDTGSKYTIIPKDIFVKNWPQLELKSKDICHGGYQGEEIEILGFFSTVISFKSRETFAKVYVAESGPPILGWMHQYDLNIILNPRGKEQILVVDDGDVSAILEEVEEVFRAELGEFKGYVHKIHMKQGTVAVIHKVRKVPIVVREEVSKMLKDMLKEGVIEPVEAPEWISPVVITRKSNGQLRFCVDLRSVNQNIVTDNFPLPNINELIMLINGGFFFLQIRSQKRLSSDTPTSQFARCYRIHHHRWYFPFC
ncbi:hypothetical protein NDU88_005684 [Pleurodeles waltl]|uniref:Peptidase A2 domain-containing protein n=1 Tax=Pleurodeles waltl TaxID=8319 RepID=A0AAV7RLQ6_PLEWA|nr:hypothetical protein NDU88_005684 [Pleurodeles waltl]